MRIGFRGELVDEKEIRAGFIGCGSHSFRNIYPTFQFTPVKLVATCDRQLDKAQAFAEAFGAEAAYDDCSLMLQRDDLDAVFIVTGYDDQGRPQFPRLAHQCLAAGKHVWIEKPPAATTSEIEQLQAAAASAGKTVLVGMKKMFFPANEKAKELMDDPDFGPASLVLLQYPQSVPTIEQFRRYLHSREPVREVMWFLDHVVHPVSLLVYLLGMPATLCYQRSTAGAAVANFTYASGAVASVALSAGASMSGALERTTIVSANRRHIVVDNNVRVSLHRPVNLTYGASPSFYTGSAEQATLLWEPEWSLGQLYNKGLFLLGYYGEVNEFARAILEGRPPTKGTLEQAWQVTRVFEAFGEGPDKTISLE